MSVDPTDLGLRVAFCGECGQVICEADCEDDFRTYLTAIRAERDALAAELKLREAQISGVEVRLTDYAAKLAEAERLGDALAEAAQSDWDCTDDRGDDAMRIAARLHIALTAWRARAK